MGKDSVHFKCHHCSHCCTEVVCLPTPWDVIQVAKSTGAHPREFLDFLAPDEITGVAKNDPTWLKCGGSRYMMALRRRDSACHFLDRKTLFCTIYAVRPILCRLFPFKLLESRRGDFRGFGLHGDVKCPRHRDGLHSTRPLQEMFQEDADHQDDYQDLVRIFNRRRVPDRKPEDFIAMFVAMV